MKRKTILIVGTIVIVGGGLGYLSVTSDTQKTTKVAAALVEKQSLVETVSASGRIQPQTKVDITSEVNGEIINLLVREGQRVKTGDLLVVLDTVQLRSDVDQAKYAMDESTAKLTGAQTVLAQAEEEYNRQKRLFEQDLTSETQYNNTRYDYLNAKSTGGAAEAQAAQAKARYEKQLDYLSKAKIVAPMNGVVTFLDCEMGEIAAAQTAFTQGKTLMTISDLNVFEVEVEVDETEINKIALAQDAEIEVDAFPDTTFKGEVVEIGNTAVTQGYGSQDQSTNFNVKVIFKDADVKIRPGMSATVDVTTAKSEGVLAVPFSAVVIRSLNLDSLEAARAAEEAGEDPEEDPESSNDGVHAAETDASDTAKADKEINEPEEIKGVFLIRDGKAFFVPVKTGIADQKNIEITSGVAESDSVISGPYRALRQVKDGDAVEVEKEDGEGN